MKRIIAVNSNCYHGFPIEEALERIAAAGFRAVELTATKGWTEHVFPTMPFRSLLTIKQQIKQLGLQVVAMSGHTNLMDAARLDDFVANIHLAHFMEAPIIVTSVGEAHLSDEEVSSDEVVVKHVHQLIPLLESLDMMLVIENHGEHGSGHRIRQIIDKVDHPRVKLNYDTANAVFYGDLDVVDDFVESLADIAYIHLKDKAGAKREWNFPALSQGDLPLGKLLSILEESANPSPLSLEIEFTTAGASSIDEVDQALRISRDYLISLGYEGFNHD